MIKISSLVLDVYDDVDAVVAKDLPPELHQSKVASVDEVANLPDRCFGLVMKTASGEIRRRFPLHDEDSLKLSEAYFEKTRHLLPVEAVKAAEAKFAATRAGEGYNDVAYVDLSGLRKTASADDVFSDRCYGLTLGDQNRFPLHDESLVKRAVARFPFSVEGLDPQHRFVYARNICKRASALGMEVPSSSPVHLYSADALNREALLQAIDQRKSAAKTASTVVLDQLAEAAGCRAVAGPLEHADSVALREAKIASRPPLSPGRIIATLQQFDKAAGLGEPEYNRGLLDPFAACYKQAAFPGGSGMIVDGVDLSKISPATLAEHFDDDFVAEFTRSPVNVYKSLPDPVKSVVRGLAESKMKSGPPQKTEPPIVSSAGDPTHRLAPTYANGTASVVS